MLIFKEYVYINMSDKTAKQKNTERKLMPTFSKSVRKGAVARENEQHEKLMQSNYLRNQFLLKTRAKNYEMERDRLNGILANNRTINNRRPRLVARCDVLQHHINYLEPIIGDQGRYTYVEKTNICTHAICNDSCV